MSREAPPHQAARAGAKAVPPSAPPSAAAPTGKGAGGYEVARPLGQCARCGGGIEPEARFMAALRETPLGFERLDCCVTCWEKFPRDSAAAHAAEPAADLADGAGQLVGFWKAVMPRPEARKKLFVDDEVLCTLFERLAGATEQAKLHFRFVLGLILMRKRIILFEGSRREGGKEGLGERVGESGGEGVGESARDVWSVRFRGREEKMDLIDPHLNEEQVQGVSQQLGEILNEEL